MKVVHYHDIAIYRDISGNIVARFENFRVTEYSRGDAALNLIAVLKDNGIFYSSIKGYKRRKEVK